VGAGVEVGATVGAGDGATVGAEVAVAAGRVAKLVGAGGAVAGTTAGVERKAWVGVGAGCAQATLSQANIARRLGTKDARKPVSSLPFINRVRLDRGAAPRLPQTGFEVPHTQSRRHGRSRPGLVNRLGQRREGPPAVVVQLMVSKAGAGRRGVTTRRTDGPAVASSDNRRGG
jgi:hypothetical protein